MPEELPFKSRPNTHQEALADTLWDINGELAKCSAETPPEQIKEKLLKIETIAQEVSSTASQDVKMEMFIALQHAETWEMVDIIPHVKAIAESLREEE